MISTTQDFPKPLHYFFYCIGPTESDQDQFISGAILNKFVSLRVLLEKAYIDFTSLSLSFFLRPAWESLSPFAAIAMSDAYHKDMHGARYYIRDHPSTTRKKPIRLELRYTD